MNTAHLSFQKARALASAMRTKRQSGHGWDGRIDRDLVRETHEIYLLSQSTSPRVM